MRLAARLTDELSRKLLALERATGRSRSAIVRAALERYVDEARLPGRSARDAIHASDLVGCGEAEPNLAGNYYKARLHEILERKHGHR